MAWRYDEILSGNSYQGFILDGARVVCTRKHHGIDVNNPGEEVERTRRELQAIVEHHAAEAVGGDS